MGSFLDGLTLVGPVLVAIFGLIWPEKMSDLSRGTWSGPAYALVISVAVTMLATIASIVSRQREKAASDARQVASDGRLQKAEAEAGRMRDEVRRMHDDERKMHAEERRIHAVERKIRAVATTLPVLLESSSKKENALRFILQAIVEAAWFYDGKRDDSDYGANIMVFTTSEPSTVLFRGDVAVSGFLVLDRDLSTTRSGTPGAPDGSLSIFGLPVPEQKNGKCLPGAPLAFLRANMDFYADTRELPAWCEKESFPPAVQDEIRHYFTGDGKNVRSMLSVPLPPNGAQPVAVLNIHAYHEGMFGSAGDHAAEFVELAEELFRMLSNRLLLNL